MTDLVVAADNPLVQRLGWTLLHFVWQGALLGLCIGLLLVVLRHSLSTLRYKLLLAGFGLMALTPVVTFFVLTPQPPVIGEPPSSIEPLAEATLTRPTAAITPPDVSAFPPLEPQFPSAEPPLTLPGNPPAINEASAEAAIVAAPIDERSISQRIDLFLPWLVAGWLLGVVALSLRLIGAWRRIQRLVRCDVCELETRWAEVGQRLLTVMQVRRTVRFLESQRSVVPVVIGWLKPVVVVPTSILTSLTFEEAEALLAHELAHIRRCDEVVNLLQTVFETLFFYHPAVWWISARLRQEREHCCDDLAAEVVGDRLVYSRALVAAAQLAADRPHRLAVASTGGKLQQRILRLMEGGPRQRIKTRWPVVTALAIVGLLTLSILASRPQADEQDAVAPVADVDGPETDAPAEDARPEQPADDPERSSAEEPVADAPESDRAGLAVSNGAETEAARIHFDETMIVVWNEQGAAAIVFDPPPRSSNSDPDGADAAGHVSYQWRLNDGTEEELTGAGELPISTDPQLLEVGPLSVMLDQLSCDQATVVYHPRTVCVHPLDRTFSESQDLVSRVRPLVDLTGFLLPDEAVQEWIRDRPYTGQSTEPGYLRHPLTSKVRYFENSLIVATPDGVAAFDFIAPLVRTRGNERREGVEYDWRFVSADGRRDESGTGAVWELSRDGQNIYEEALHYMEAGPIHIPWSRNSKEAGWVYYDPAWHGVWFVTPSKALPPADRDANWLRSFAFGPRPFPNEGVIERPANAPAGDALPDTGDDPDRISAAPETSTDEVLNSREQTPQQLIAGIEQAMQRFLSVEYSAEYEGLRDRNGFGSGEKLVSVIERTGGYRYRSDGRRWFVDEHSLAPPIAVKPENGSPDWWLNQGLSGFDGNVHYMREGDVVTLGEDSLAVERRAPHRVFWEIGKNWSWLKSALVSPSAEVKDYPVIDGHVCVNVVSERTLSDGTKFQYVIVISPEQSFLPISCEIRRNGELDTTWTMEDLAQTDDGLWYPGTIVTEYANPFPTKSMRLTITEFDVRNNFADEDFAYSVPAGVDVVDYPGGMVYFNDPWWPELKTLLRERFDYPTPWLSPTDEMGSYADGAIDGRPAPAIEAGEWINGDPGGWDRPGRDYTVLFFFGGRPISPTPKWLAGLTALQQKYGEGGLELMGVVTSEGAEGAKQTAREFGLTFPIAVAAESERRGSYGKPHDAFGLQSYAGVFVIDPDGIVHTVDPQRAEGKEPGRLEPLIQFLMGLPAEEFARPDEGLSQPQWQAVVNEWKQLRAASPANARMSGRVTLDRAGPAAIDFENVKVTLFPMLPIVSGHTPYGHTRQLINDEFLTVACDADGRFEFTGLRKGTYSLVLNGSIEEQERPVRFVAVADEDSTVSIDVTVQQISLNP